MQLFHMLMKRAKIQYNCDKHAMMVDPFVRPLIDSLSSENVPALIESLVCFTFLIKFKSQ